MTTEGSTESIESKANYEETWINSVSQEVELMLENNTLRSQKICTNSRFMSYFGFKFGESSYRVFPKLPAAQGWQIWQ